MNELIGRVVSNGAEQDDRSANLVVLFRGAPHLTRVGSVALGDKMKVPKQSSHRIPTSSKDL